MCSLARIPPASIGLYCSYEELFMSLDEMTRGYSIPENVTADVNPYQHRPSNLPDGIWYFLRSEQKKDSEYGFWKARDEACKIYTNSGINGWRTTLDFYEGQSPQGRRTGWIIQEYRITQGGLHSNSNPKESSSLCNLFHSCGGSSSPEIKHELGAAEVARSSNILPKPSAAPFSGTGSTTGQGCATESQAGNRGDSTGPLAAVGELENIPVEIPELDYILRGDYLELNDLVDPGSRSFSSDNSSCVTMTSEECFDSLALLQDLKEEIDPHEQSKDANFKRSVAASVRPSEVVMHTENLGSLICNNGHQSPAIENKFPNGRVPEIAVNCQKAEKGKEGMLHNAASSSSTHKAEPKGGKHGLGSGMKKLKKKYLCFMPF